MCNDFKMITSFPAGRLFSKRKQYLFLNLQDQIESIIYEAKMIPKTDNEDFHRMRNCILLGMRKHLEIHKIKQKVLFAFFWPALIDYLKFDKYVSLRFYQPFQHVTFTLTSENQKKKKIVAARNIKLRTIKTNNIMQYKRALGGKRPTLQNEDYHTVIQYVGHIPPGQKHLIQTIFPITIDYSIQPVSGLLLPRENHQYFL